MSDEDDVLEEEEEISDEEEDIPEPEEEMPKEERISDQEEIMGEFLGLNEKQLQVYSLILTLGQVTTGDIAIVMGVSTEEVQNIIPDLESRKLLTTLPGVVPRYQAVPPFAELVKEVSTIGERIERLREDLKEQLRTASMTVRDSLYDLAKENLEKIESHKSQQDTRKSKAIEEIGSVMDNLSETSKKVLEDSTSSIESTTERVKGEASSKIAPVLSSAKDEIASQGAALTSEVQSWASSAKGISGNLKSGLTGHVNTFREKVVRLLDDQNRTISENVSTQLETTSSELQKSKIIQLEQLGILRDNTTETLSSLSNQISHVLTEAQNSIGKSLESVSNRVAGELEQVQQSFTDKVQEYSISDDAAITEFETGSDESFDEYARKQNQALENLASSISNVTDNLATQSQTACTSISHQVDGLATRTQDQMTNAMGGMREMSASSIQDVYRVTDSSSRSLLGETETQLSSGKEKLQTALDMTSASMKNLNQSSLETYSGLLDKTRSTVAQQLGGIAERTKARIEGFANTAIGDLEALKQTLQVQIAQAIAKGSEQIQAVTTSASTEIEQGVESEIQRLGTRLDEQITEYRTMHDTLSANIDETITDQVRQQSEILDGLLNRATMHHDEMLEEVDTIRRHSIGDLDNKLSESKAIAVDSILQMKSETSEIIQNMETLFQESIGASNSKTQGAITGVRSATDTYVNSLRKSRSSLIAGIRTRREELRSSSVESIGLSVADSQTHLRDSTASTLQTLTENSDEMRTSVQTELTSVGEKGSSLLSSASEEVTQAFDTVDSSLRTTLSEVKDSLSESLEGLKGGLEEQSTSLLSQLDSSLSELDSTIDTTSAQKQAGIESASQKAQTGIESLSEGLTSSVESAADSLKSETIEIVTSSMDTATKSIEGLRPELERGLANGYTNLGTDTTAVEAALIRLMNKLEESPMLGLTEDTLDEAFAAPADGAGSDAAAVLSKVWERVGATDFPGAKDFWTVSTRSAVLAHISDMVQRAKSKITLILAYPAEIPSDMLVELKSAVGVELVVTEGGLLADKARPLVGRGNIRIRTRTDMDVYACVRDSEEVLLAPVTKDDRDVIGIATEDPGFIKFVMGVVGPIFQAKTKLLRPGDI